MKNLVSNSKNVVSVVSHRFAPVAAVGAALALSAHGALAQQAGNTIGGQVQTMAQEFSTTGGFVGSTAMYIASLICFVFGAWAFWQSRQAENRDSGMIAKGLAGLVLCGLFVTGGSWINKAAQTSTGTDAAISSTAGVVSFQ
ncbi:hypothetical protein M2322_004478 [Rhodoblastus acidophilus]|uniref:hypothetical protein n=1 Tax=Rhodoblastus acidophilus TaxID=1074 RepID=UPI002225AEC6|nr:hypothetical protein [Rhodoblastus acidophilus]MCW2318909.1 hypothetical protein [Rhodoblastus acidophilus]